MPAILAKKLGMTQLFLEDGKVERVTVLEAGPCPVTAVRTNDVDGYEAVQLAFGETSEKRLTKGELGHLKKAGAGAMRTLVEFRDVEVGGTAEGGESAEGDDEAPEGDESEKTSESTGVKVGDDVTVASFEPGERVKVSAISIGKGFQGTIKRHNFSRGPESHGSHNVRAPGSIGASADPARVFKGMGMPGQMGARRVTQRGAHVVEVDAERNLLLIRGSVPGGKNATVEVRSDG
jgi:large subunit ribosomal protein L3